MLTDTLKTWSPEQLRQWSLVCYSHIAFLDLLVPPNSEGMLRPHSLSSSLSGFIKFVRVISETAAIEIWAQLGNEYRSYWVEVYYAAG